MSYQTPLFPVNRPLTTVDSVYQWVPGVSVNKIMPPGSKQTSGWAVDERPPAQWFNGLWGADAQWITFLDTMIGDFNFDAEEKMGIGFESFKGASGTLANSVGLGQSAAGNTNGFSITAIGHSAALGAGGDNIIALGYQAGINCDSDTIAIGNAASRNSVGVQSTMVGFEAGADSSAITNAVCIGYQAGEQSTGEAEVCIGSFAGQLGNLDFSVGIGKFAGAGMTGTDTVMIGQDSGRDSNSTNSVYIGSFSGKNSVGNGIVAIGKDSAFSAVLGDIDGDNYVAMGLESLGAATGFMGTSIFIGYQAGKNIVVAGVPAANQNIFIGEKAGIDVTGTQSIGIGPNVGTGNTGSLQIMIGLNAGLNHGAGAHTIMIGNTAGSGGSSQQSVILGLTAGDSLTGSDHVAIGTNAGSNSLSALNLIAIGNGAGASSHGNSNIFIGQDSGVLSDVSAASNIAMGVFSSRNTQVSNGTTIGNNSGDQNRVEDAAFFGNHSGDQIGISSTAGNLGNNITAIGNEAFYWTGDLAVLKIPDNSIFIGNEAGKNWQPTGLLATNWVTSSFDTTHAVLQINSSEDNSMIFGFFDEGAPTLSVIGTNAMLKAGVSSFAQRNAFESLWSDGGVGFPEAIGAMTLDSSETTMHVFTSSGWKSWTLT